MTTKINDQKELVKYVSKMIYIPSVRRSGGIVDYPVGNYEKHVYRITNILEEAAGGETSYPLTVNTRTTLSGGFEEIKVKGKGQSKRTTLKIQHIWGRGSLL